MAEVAILGGLLKKLPYSTMMQQLGSLAIDEVKYLSGLKPELESLERQLRLISPYLKEADAKSYKSNLTKEWVRQLRDLAFEAEDAIDTFVYKMAQKVVTKPIDAHKLRDKIQEMKGKLKELFDNKGTFEIKPLEEGETSDRHETLRTDSRPLDDVVGFEIKEEELVRLLISEDPRKRWFRVVSINGRPGVGKTTLAKKIYCRNDVQNHFVCPAFVSTKKKKAKDVLMEIMKQVMLVNEADDLASKSVSDLREQLSDFLKEKQKNYLFVLDDVRTTEDWDDLKEIFPVPCNSQQYSVVLLTTRDERVGQRADPRNNHKLYPLDEEKSELLFSKVFFGVQNDSGAKRLFNDLNKEMGGAPREVVKKCDGLPVAILLLTSLLLENSRTLRIPAGWERVRNGLDRHPNSGTHEMLGSAVFAMSYSELSHCLKSCVLYFGGFPEATEIKKDRLIRLWVAEGFMERDKEKLTMEEQGGQWLETLRQRNLIEVGKWKSNGVPESFIIPNLLWTFAILEAEEGKFLNISTPNDSWQNYRRVAVHHECSEDSMTGSHHSFSNPNFMLRSLLCFNGMSPLICGKFKLLNVLDLEGAPRIEILPDEIGNLILLKYLSLCGTGLETLPCWVGRLYNLQTLNLYKTRIKSVPIEIFELEKLRHLLCFNNELRTSDDFIVKSNTWVRVRRFIRHSTPRRIKQLRDLQTLWFHTSSWIEDGFEKLTKLRELGLTGLAGVMEKFREALHQALEELKLLEILYLEEQEQDSQKNKEKEKQKQDLPKTKEEQEQESSSGVERKILPTLSGHKYLQIITFIGGGQIRKLPHLEDFPPSLTRLRLANILLQQDMIETLKDLPFLEDLTLDWRSYDGTMMTFSTGGFPKLENLTLIRLEKLMLWIVENGAMPNLKMLEINSLFCLKCIPIGLRHIKKLQKLSLSMPKEFLERVKEGGWDWETIKHVNSMKERRGRSQNITEVQIPKDVRERIAKIDPQTDEFIHTYCSEHLPQDISRSTPALHLHLISLEGPDLPQPCVYSRRGRIRCRRRTPTSESKQTTTASERLKETTTASKRLARTGTPSS